MGSGGETVRTSLYHFIFAEPTVIVLRFQIFNAGSSGFKEIEQDVFFPKILKTQCDCSGLFFCFFFFL